MSGPISPWYSPGGGNGIAGSRSSGWTFTKAAETGVAETICTWKISDNATSQITFENASASDTALIPQIRGVHSSTAQALRLMGQGTTDTGTTAFIEIVNRIGTSTTPATRPAIKFIAGSSTYCQFSARGKFTLTPASSGNDDTLPTFAITAPADITIDAGTEVNTFLINAVTKTWSAGALATQRENLIKAPTYAFVSASTITSAATVTIDAAPIAGTNATITNPYAFWVQAGKAQFDGGAALGLRLDLKSYTVGTLPAAGAAGGVIFVSDAGGNGPCIAVSNGTNWKRCDNVSTTVV